jgi:hypothetical protein
MQQSAEKGIFRAIGRRTVVRPEARTLKRDGFTWNPHHALALCLRMIFSEKRHPLFRIMR